MKDPSAAIKTKKENKTTKSQPKQQKDSFIQIINQYTIKANSKTNTIKHPSLKGEENHIQ